MVLECWGLEHARGSIQSTPPKPAGQEHCPLNELQSAYWAQLKAGRRQLKLKRPPHQHLATRPQTHRQKFGTTDHGGQSLGRSSIRASCARRASMPGDDEEKFWARAALDSSSAPKATARAVRDAMVKGTRR